MAEIKVFPGYGVVYPDGRTGFKVVGTFTDAPKRIIEADGSTTYTTPAPTIHELYGGGFAYASGELVTDRTHLELITSKKMRARALEWFDNGRQAKVDTDVPPYDPEEKKEAPEPVYVLSTQVPSDPDDKAVAFIDKTQKHFEEEAAKADPNALLIQVLGSLNESMKVQGEKLDALAAAVTGKGKAHKKSSETMKEKWKNPEYRAARLAKMKADREAMEGKK